MAHRGNAILLCRCPKREAKRTLPWSESEAPVYRYTSKRSAAVGLSKSENVSHFFPYFFATSPTPPASEAAPSRWSPGWGPRATFDTARTTSQRRVAGARTFGLSALVRFDVDVNAACVPLVCLLSHLRLDPVSYTHLTLPTNREV